MPTSETHCRHIRPAFLHFQKESNSGKQIVATEKHHRIGPARCEQQHAGVHAYGIVPSFSTFQRVLTAIIVMRWCAIAMARSHARDSAGLLHPWVCCRSVDHANF